MEEQMNLFDFQVEEVKVERVDDEYKLTPRQEALYRLIKQNTLEGRKTTQAEICDKIEGYSYNNGTNSHDHCPQIWIDISGERGINWSPSKEKIIIVKDFEYWIGSKEEVKAYLSELWNVGISPRLKRYWALVDKNNSDGKGKLFTCRGDLMKDDSKARRYVEAFLEHPELL